MAALLFDAQISSPRLITAIRERGLDARAIAAVGGNGRPDPEVVLRIVQDMRDTPWVLVTMDLTITDDFPGFEWDRYAIAWVMLRQGVLGAAVEIEKTEIVQRHAHDMREQGQGDHHSYTAGRRHKSPPSLASLTRRV